MEEALDCLMGVTVVAVAVVAVVAVVAAAAVVAVAAAVLSSNFRPRRWQPSVKTVFTTAAMGLESRPSDSGPNVFLVACSFFH